jgi:hypothetical protein
MDAQRPRGRPVITVATELSELEELFSFRYRIYGEEMQRKHVNHASYKIRDPLDEFATNLIARDADGAIISADQSCDGPAPVALDYGPENSDENWISVVPEIFQQKRHQAELRRRSTFYAKSSA